MGFSVDIVFGAALKNDIFKGNDQKAKSILSKAAQKLLSQDRLLSAVPYEGNENIYWVGITDPLNMDSLVSSINVGEAPAISIHELKTFTALFIWAC